MNNKVQVLTAAAFLMAKKAAPNASGLSANTVKDLDAGKIELQHSNLLHRVSFVAGNNVDLLQASNIRRNGISDFQGRKLDPSTNFVADSIRFGFVESLTANDVAGAAFVNDRESIPAAIQNSILEIHQDGKRILRVAVTDLLTQVASDSKSEKLELGGLVLLRGDVDTEIKLIMPEGSAVVPAGGNSLFASIEFGGFVTAPRG